jgi:hypothetical protein
MFGSLFLGYVENENQVQLQKSQEIFQDYQYYRLIDNLVGDAEDQFFAQADALTRLKMMYAQLTERSEFEYMDMYPQPIYLVADELNKELLYGYEEGNVGEEYWLNNEKKYYFVKCLWISDNVNKIFDLPCSSGEFWNEQQYQSDIVPVVLGSAYEDIYQVGQIISGDIILDNDASLQVVGILEKGDWLFYGSRMINLDRYVLCPLLDQLNLPTSTTEYKSQVMRYLFKINGLLRSKVDTDSIQEIINNICNACGITPVSTVANGYNEKSEIIYESIETVSIFIHDVIIGFILFTVSATLLHLILTLERNFRYYAVLIVNGYSMREIREIILGSILLRLAIADAAAILLYEKVLSVWLTGRTSYTVWVLSNLVLLLSSYILCTVKLKRTDLMRRLGEEADD